MKMLIKLALAATGLALCSLTPALAIPNAASTVTLRDTEATPFVEVRSKQGKRRGWHQGKTARGNHFGWQRGRGNPHRVMR